MDNESDWGPWVEHDGRGCPCVGEYVHAKFSKIGKKNDGTFSDECYGVAENTPKAWDDDFEPHKWVKIIRYRIRKPRIKAMDILRALVQDPDTPINAPTGPVRELTPA